MLVLSRRESESICIGHNVVVTVVQIRRNSVRLSIDAPPEVPVHREELRDRIEAAIRRAEAHVGTVGSPDPDAKEALPVLEPPGSFRTDGCE